ncbi:MAG: hypothetical protein F4139_00575 [Gemmatimonadetes bacterium]|nr:hypothetical protein [Gemmatimonadota bacterium]MXW16323.1 hypothetical protein [Gemmatimonadota bacterium]MYA63574.1 hypothetical protein [Gemmatimonadota bacterium]MYB96952.1 hypothetical protein [Gemmatimonadota bacterium]MYH51423.1 hypothetical protein [Gemmatimonadota bacterium]
MDLIEELREIRDKADRLIETYRYSEIACDRDDAYLAVLAEARGEWRSIDDVRKELAHGGRPVSKGAVGAVLLDLEKAGRLEGMMFPTGRPRGEKRYRSLRSARGG